MRLTGLVADNLLSFDHLELDQIDPRLTTIVGPNGSGKTNLARLLTLALTALDWVEDNHARGASGRAPAEAILSSYAAARYRNTPIGEPLRLKLGIELTSAAEREQLTCFVQSAIISTVLSRSGRQQQDGPVLSEWAVEQVTSERLAPLMSGALTLKHPGSAHAAWQVAYEFQHDGTSYRWILADRHAGHEIVRAADHAAGTGVRPQSQDLPQALFSIASSGASSEPLPAPLPQFSLARLLPKSGDAVQLSVQSGGGHFDLDLEPHRRFDQLVGPASAALSRTFSLASVLRLIFHHGIAVIGEQLRGADEESRPLPIGRYTLDQMRRPDLAWEPSALPLRLFHLKNGDSSQRQRFERIRRMFGELAPGRRLDLRFEPESDPEFAITIVIGEGSVEDTWELPVTFTGAGVWEALVLAEAVTDGDDRVIVLDEPALNLHPAWQRLLAARVREAQGQFLLITHSPYLVPIERSEDLAGLVRLSRRNGAATLHRHSSATALDDQLRSRIIREFSLSADARALLFAAGAVLVEGETELGALPAWFERSEAARTLGTPGRLHLGFHSVGGEKHFTPVLALLAALGIPWVIVCDGGAFRADMGGSHIFRQVIDAGAANAALQEFGSKKLSVSDTELTFEEVVAVGRDHGIFTLARGWTRAVKKNGIAGDESFEAFAKTIPPGKLAEAEAAVGSSKVRSGRRLAENVPCPDPVNDLYRQILAFLKDQGMPGLRSEAVGP